MPPEWPVHLHSVLCFRPDYKNPRFAQLPLSVQSLLHFLSAPNCCCRRWASSLSVQSQKTCNKKQLCQGRAAKVAIWVKSALRELRCTTGSLQTVFLTFLHTRIAGQEAFLLQSSTVLLVLLQQSAAQAVADSASLTGNTAAGNADDDIVLASRPSRTSGERTISFRSPDQSNCRYHDR